MISSLAHIRALNKKWTASRVCFLDVLLGSTTLELGKWDLNDSCDFLMLLSNPASSLVILEFFLTFQHHFIWCHQSNSNVLLQSTFFCECEDGYTGSFCEEFDACHCRPCSNNGTCTDIRQGLDGRDFTCTCPIGVFFTLNSKYQHVRLKFIFVFVCVSACSLLHHLKRKKQWTSKPYVCVRWLDKVEVILFYSLHPIILLFIYLFSPRMFGNIIQ